MTRTATGFTLVELLVVITIIAVLLSLLTPALDQAVYQAELAVCMGNLKAIGIGVLVYSQEHRRRYPWRGLVEAQGVKPVHVYNGVNIANPADTYDDRKVMRLCFPINKALLDPFCKKVDYENALPSSAIEVSYPLWFGFRYKDPHAGRGMYRVGDRLTFNEGGVTSSFNLLASDQDMISFEGGFTHASHPDKAGKNAPVAVQDQNAVSPIFPGAGLTVTMSRWDGGDPLRGALDLNHAYDDGSVTRLVDVAVTADSRVIDRRGREMAKVDEYANDLAAGADYYLPEAH